jgi:hypothetical protein
MNGGGGGNLLARAISQMATGARNGQGAAMAPEVSTRFRSQYGQAENIPSPTGFERPTPSAGSRPDDTLQQSRPVATATTGAGPSTRPSMAEMMPNGIAQLLGGIPPQMIQALIGQVIGQMVGGQMGGQMPPSVMPSGMGQDVAAGAEMDPALLEQMMVAQQGG